MLEAAGEREQNRQIGRALQVEHPAGLLRLHVVLEADVLERLRDLAATVVEPMRLPYKSDQHVASGGFIEHHLGMAGCDDLTARFVRCLAQHLVDLPLAQDLEVSVGRVEKQHRTGVCGHVREQQHGLLLATTAGREVEPQVIMRPVGHRDLASLGDVLRLIEPASEQLVDALVKAPPSCGPILLLEDSDSTGCAAPRRCVPRRAGR